MNWRKIESYVRYIDNELQKSSPINVNMDKDHECDMAKIRKYNVKVTLYI